MKRTRRTHTAIPVRRRRLTLAISLLLGLPACTLLEEQRGGPAQPAIAAAPATPSADAEPADTTPIIPVISGPDLERQQALLDAINRDGQPIDFDGFNETTPEPVPEPEPVEDDEENDVVELNYEQADLRLILEELADALDVTIVIDPAIDSRVSIRTATDRPLRRDDIWPLIRLLTRDAGVYLEQVGDVYNARALPAGMPADITTRETLSTSNGAQVMQVTPLTYVSGPAATEALLPLLESDEDAGVRQLGARDLLLITGSEFQLQRVNQLLTLIDSDPFVNQGIRLYLLSNAAAIEVSEELAEIMTLIEGENPAYQVKGIERINGILVTAPAARGFDEITRWVEILDADSQEQVEQLFTYRVKNLLATELGATLSTVFEQSDEMVPNVVEADDPGMPPPLFPETGQDLQPPEPAPEAAPAAAPAAAAGAAVSADLSVRIVADEATNSLLIRSTARDYRQLLTTISQLDVVPLQVMVSAVIAQITLTDETRFGVDWERVADNAEVNDVSTELETSFLPETLRGVMFTKNFLDGAARVDATLRAIAVDNEVELLSRPSITVSNNQQGEIQIGSEVPVEAGEAIAAGGIATSNIQYRPTGIELYITPQINDDGIVSLVIRQVLSAIDTGSTGVNENPVFTNQEISTTVTVRNGENVVLGGLIQTDREVLNSGIPLLNRVPVAGRLFSYTEDTMTQRELFIVLRPEIINLNDETSIQYPEIIARFELASQLLEEVNY